jgi:SAM-dependent methyltransferase
MTNEQYFDDLVKKHGVTSKGVGMSEYSHLKRFEAIYKVCGFEHRKHVSVLDIGCGYGAFLEFLSSKGLSIKEYTGLDVSKEMIVRAPVYSFAYFMQEDIFDFSPKRKWDFVIANGILNLKMPGDDNYIFMSHLLKIAFHFCKIAAAVTMTFDQGQKKDPATHYFDRSILCAVPAEPKWISYDWTYLPNDFMIYMER